MKPLVSGAEVKRFIAPATDTYVLFPYALAGGNARLRSVAEMETDYPRAWAWLKSHEPQLRARENREFDDDAWYRFGRSQNIDKQDFIKLLVPRLVSSLKVAIDTNGSMYCDNVDVGGRDPCQR